MKRQAYILTGVGLYLFLLGLLMNFNWIEILRPIPVLSVVLGICIMTLFQYQKGQSKEQMLLNARWNAFFAGMITTLFSLLSLFSGGDYKQLGIVQLAPKITPLIYGSILYLLIDSLLERQNKNPEKNVAVSPFVPSVATPILISKGFTSRECHVALKLLEEASNKEIAQQLYISEATVKKHIQNMFRKCNAKDRQEFKVLYLAWMDESV